MNHDVMQAPTRQEALKKLLDVWTVSVETEYVPLADCLDRISSKDIYAMYTIPQKRISAMDGYAVKSQNFADGMPDISKWTMSVDFTPADTGDDFPDEYDTVIPVEQLHFGEDGKLTLAEDFLFRMGSGIRPAGSIMKAGDLLIRKNTRITPELQANLAVGGIRIVSVLKMPVVAFIPTGSELTSAGLEPQRGQNVECNSLLISAYLKKWGAKPVVFPIVRDMPDLLQKAMDEALKFADIVILNGGSSKGTEDYTSRMMEQRSSYFEHTVRTVPGRPVGIAMIDGKPVINMPGPTMAAWVVSDWLLYPMICHYYGISVEKRKCVQAFLTADMKKGPPVEVYSKVRLENRAGLYYATPIGREARNSEMLRDGLGLIIAPIGEMGHHKGQPVSVELMTDETLIPVTEVPPHVVLPDDCNQCDNHCPSSALKCGRGKAYFTRIKNGEQFRCDNDCVNLLVDVAQAVKHIGIRKQQHNAGTDDLLDGLSTEEQEQLRLLLQKQQAKMNADHAKRHAIGARSGHENHHF